MTERPPDDNLPPRDDLSDATLDERLDPDVEPEPGDDAEVEPPGSDDPDLEAARAHAPSQDPQTLTTEELRPEEEIVEYEPPDEPTPGILTGATAGEQRTGETLDDRLAQEEPEAPEQSETAAEREEELG